MTTTGWLVIAGIALVIAYCAVILLVQTFAEWGVRREAERTAAATFEADYIAENGDVAREQADRDACVALAEVVDMLEEVGIEVRR